MIHGLSFCNYSNSSHAVGHCNISFQSYFHDVLNELKEDVETFVTEPLEPLDVRKNRQLTLDNMKLHRDLEKLKQGAFEHDQLKRDLRLTKVKFEEEKKHNSRLEYKLQCHNTKVSSRL
jgi:hypothetical protein